MLCVCDVCHTYVVAPFPSQVKSAYICVMSCFSFKQTECVTGQCLICTLFGLEVIPFQKNTNNKKYLFHLTIFFSNRWTLQIQDGQFHTQYDETMTHMYANRISVQEGF